MDDNARMFLERSLVNGNAVLFTGAGYSRGAMSTAGLPLPLGWELATALWPIAFPEQPFDDASSLGEIYDVAVRVSPGMTKGLLEHRLRADSNGIPDYYYDYMRLPWFRIYTLNLDDLLDVVARKATLPRSFRSVAGSKLTHMPYDDLLGVHLNGRLVDFPDVTFSAPQYGERTSAPDVAYTTLANDLMSHPVIYIGTQLDEAPLWHHISMRGSKGPGRELRPRSFLVAPKLPVARAAMLDRFNVIHVPMTAEEFAQTYVTSSLSKLPPSLPFRAGAIDSAWLSVNTARSLPAEEPAEFLMGREPSWSDFTSGYAITRSFEVDLPTRAAASSVLLVTGTAGSGKSTTLMRLALELQTAGKAVGWLRPESGESLARIASTALSAGLDTCVIDDADRFGDRLPDLIQRITGEPNGPHVVLSVSGVRAERSLADALPSGMLPEPVVVPPLEDSDIDSLLDALAAASRLGRLAGKPRDEQVATFRDKAGRQLLVAMIEATSGRRFEEKIVEECQDLPEDVKLPYAVTALATSHGYKIPQEEVAAATGDAPRAIEALDTLTRSHLIFRSTNKLLQTRHALVAERAVNYFRTSGALTAAIEGLAFVLSTKVYVGMPRNQTRRLLTVLINHDYLRRQLTSRFEVRSLYQKLEPTLRDDPHYWLQRGSYELEEGDLQQADVFLAQARGMNPGDYMIDTEWSYLLLRQAVADPKDSISASRANEALDLLFDVVDRFGQRTPNTYAVLAQSGSLWYEVSGLSQAEKRLAMTTLRATVQEGLRKHAANRGLRAAAEDLERRYLLLSVTPA